MKIYDCFSYWDEDLLLDLRLNILNEYVDYFVIVEGNKTWQNNSKKLRFDINKFPNFKKKIIYIPVKDMPDGDDPYIRENFQRNCILRGLKSSSDNDLIIISDLDEIPNPLKIKQFKKRPFWRIDKLRLNNIIENGGWHFCNLKNAEQLLYKYKNLCETNDPYHFKEKIDDKYLVLDEIQKKINTGQDIIGRNEIYKVKKLDGSFPKKIIENKDFYSEWIAD